MEILKRKHDNELSELFQKHGVFFAFSKKQYNEQADPSKKYVSLTGTGGFCPEETAMEFMEELGDLQRKQRDEKLETFGKEKIILYELRNHECFYTGDYSEIYEDMEDYGITKEEVEKVFFENVAKYDN